MAAAGRRPDELEYVGGTRGVLPRAGRGGGPGPGAVRRSRPSWPRGFTTICVKPLAVHRRHRGDRRVLPLAGGQGGFAGRVLTADRLRPVRSGQPREAAMAKHEQQAYERLGRDSCHWRRHRDRGRGDPGVALGRDRGGHLGLAVPRRWPRWPRRRGRWTWNRISSPTSPTGRGQGAPCPHSGRAGSGVKGPLPPSSGARPPHLILASGAGGGTGAGGVRRGCSRPR